MVIEIFITTIYYLLKTGLTTKKYSFRENGEEIRELHPLL